MIQHIALIHKETGSRYGVSFPDLPGVTAAADTPGDALREAGIALGVACEDREGEQPAARMLDELRRDPDFSTGHRMR